MLLKRNIFVAFLLVAMPTFSLAAKPKADFAVQCKFRGGGDLIYSFVSYGTKGILTFEGNHYTKYLSADDVKFNRVEVEKIETTPFIYKYKVTKSIQTEPIKEFFINRETFNMVLQVLKPTDFTFKYYQYSPDFFECTPIAEPDAYLEKVTADYAQFPKKVKERELEKKNQENEKMQNRAKVNKI